MGILFPFLGSYNHHQWEERTCILLVEDKMPTYTKIQYQVCIILIQLVGQTYFKLISLSNIIFKVNRTNSFIVRCQLHKLSFLTTFNSLLDRLKDLSHARACGFKYVKFIFADVIHDLSSLNTCSEESNRNKFFISF